VPSDRGLATAGHPDEGQAQGQATYEPGGAEVEMNCEKMLVNPLGERIDTVIVPLLVPAVKL
jgi:hypothetical protein